MSNSTYLEQKRGKMEHADLAYEIQKVCSHREELTSQRGALRGAAVWTIVGFSCVFVAHHLLPSFKYVSVQNNMPGVTHSLLKACSQFHVRDTIQVLTTATCIGIVFGAERELQKYEHDRRSYDNLIRSRAMRELGQRGIVASETEITKWREELINSKIAAHSRADL